MMTFKSMDTYEMDTVREEAAVQEPPFPESAQLCHDLEYVSQEFVLRSKSDKHFRSPRLPGQPQIELYDTAKVISHCSTDVCTTEFDAIVRGRVGMTVWSEKLFSLSGWGVVEARIVPTEIPGLHCVWDNDKIFIKPMPIWLTSQAFWLFLMHHRSEEAQGLITSSTGLLRSYATLITHASDFAIAQRYHLVPLEWNFTELVLFLDYFKSMPDSAVSPRYHLGAVQLQTLNSLSFFLRGGKMYHRIHRNRYNAYFNRYYGPTLFIFATFSVALSAMQVAIAVRQAEAPMDEARGMAEAGYGGGLGGSWKHMGYAFRWFSIYSICFAASMGMVLFCMFTGLAWMDGWEQLKARRQAKKERRRGLR